VGFLHQCNIIIIIIIIIIIYFSTNPVDT
jgi:hypothetical protein